MTLPVITFTPSPNYSSRGGNRVRLIVVHDCEGSFAGSVSWFAMAQSQVSAHGVLSEDGTKLVQMVAWGNKAWHACAVNGFSEGIEAAGYSAKGLGAAEWAALAEVVAWRLKANGIPCQVATAANNWTGYCQHVDLGQMGGGHHDVTTDPAVRASFFSQVQAAYGGASADAIKPSSAANPPPVPSGFAPTLNPRHGFDVGSLEWAQSKLNSLGFARPLLTVDGIEGKQTENAISFFQQAKGLFVDGILGPKTSAALDAAVA